MNKKQIIVMWIGIAVFVCFSFSFDPEDFVAAPIIQSASIVLVTVALIYTLKDKKKD